MKPFILAFFLLSICYYQASSQGYLDLFKSHSEPLKTNQNLIEDECLAEFIAHSLNLLDKSPENECSKEIITRYGKSDIFEPILLNYMFLIEKGSNNVTLPTQRKESVSLNYDICMESNNYSCLLSRLLNISDEHSLVNKQKKLFGKEKLSYLYSTQALVMPELYTHSISLFVTKENKVNFVDGNGKVYKSHQNLQACANEILKSQYEFEETSLYKYRSNNIVELNEQNKEAIEYFQKDICMLNQFSKMIRNDGKPNFFAFYIQSLNKLSKVLTQNEMNLVNEIWNSAKSKFMIALQKKYKNEELLGETFYIEKDLKGTNMDFTEFINTKARVLESATTTDPTPTPTPDFEAQTDDGHFQAYVWVPTVLAFVVFFSVMALVNMDFSKDTLLYAKFLTNDH